MIHPDVLANQAAKLEAAIEARYNWYLTSEEGIEVLIESMIDEDTDFLLRNCGIFDHPIEGYDIDKVLLISRIPPEFLKIQGCVTAAEQALWYALDELAARLAAGGKAQRLRQPANNRAA